MEADLAPHHIVMLMHFAQGAAGLCVAGVTGPEVVCSITSHTAHHRVVSLRKADVNFINNYRKRQPNPLGNYAARHKDDGENRKGSLPLWRPLLKKRRNTLDLVLSTKREIIHASFKLIIPPQIVSCGPGGGNMVSKRDNGNGTLIDPGGGGGVGG